VAAEEEASAAGEAVEAGSTAGEAVEAGSARVAGAVEADSARAVAVAAGVGDSEAAAEEEDGAAVDGPEIEFQRAFFLVISSTRVLYCTCLYGKVSCLISHAMQSAS
jgi:hypothetical protein